jgi:cytochrome c553
MSFRLFFLGLAALSSPVFGQTNEGHAIFQKQVAPLLQTKCAACHGTKQRISGFSTASREDL